MSMLRLPWNSCTTFAAIGSALAYALLISIFGLYWELIPGGIAGLVAVFAVSTATGGWLRAIGIGRLLAHRLIAGIGAALLSLLAGACAIAVTNLLVQAAIDLTNAPSGQPFWNAMAETLRSNAPELLVQPVLAGLIYGQWPALVLGLAYGAMLRPKTTDASPALPRVYITTGSSVMLVLIAVGTTTALTRDPGVRRHVPDGVPVGISGCGSLPVANGVLAFCPGSPCARGLCDWDTKIDAFAVFVEGPETGGWRWTGGGMGNTSSPHIVRHNMHWVQPGPDGRFGESNPQRHVSYELRFDVDGIRIGKQNFEYTPGMLLVIRYADDWSFTVGAGPGALRDTGVSIDELQQRLDAMCQVVGMCDRSFRITEPPA